MYVIASDIKRLSYINSTFCNFTHRLHGKQSNLQKFNNNISQQRYLFIQPISEKENKNNFYFIFYILAQQLWIKKKARKEGYFTLRNSLSSKVLTINKKAKLALKGCYLNQNTVAAVLPSALYPYKLFQ